jgi:hypothetical protein
VGTPEAIAANEDSHTGRYLKRLLQQGTVGDDPNHSS